MISPAAADINAILHETAFDLETWRVSSWRLSPCGLSERVSPWRSRDRGTNKVQKMELIVFFLPSSTKNPLKKGTMLFEICGRRRECRRGECRHLRAFPPAGPLFMAANTSSVILSGLKVKGARGRGLGPPFQMASDSPCQNSIRHQPAWRFCHCLP